ncbi:unnamed protein product [Miscanthus lutarioriparius]|uniref:SWIM-type domain-containing protein n=1 Tax=Miscanthus lutarioriparius TaxID=422564 RepID=A0A811NTM3_9POAL|nr:unnamed protein product [Miscanthus lutarioriparius]
MATRRLQFDEVGKNRCVAEMNEEGVAVEEVTRCNIGMQQVDIPCCNFVDSLLVGQEGPSITLFSPPATVDPSVIVTPDEEHKYSHKENLDQALIPRVGMCFKTEDEAHKFYCTYAEKAGFQPKKANKTDYTRYLRCNNYGIGKYYKGNEAKRVRGKTTKKTSCLAFIKLKFRRDKENSEEFAEITDVRLNHNHVLLPKPTETKQMRAHKYKNPLLLEYVDDLQSNDVPNHSIRNILRDMHGGEENIAMTDRDLKNRKTANMRAEHANDVNKLLEFFKDCEAENPQFRWEAKSKTLTKSKWEFEIQMGRIYTRNVFKDFEKKVVDYTAYKIEDNTEAGRNCYLVCHTNKTAKITWGQHKFKVRADKENGDFSCECREWEHTGLFCVHLLRTFIHIQVDKIPVKYIFKRYTKFARNELAFSKEDKLLTGADGNTTSYRTQLLLTKSTKVVQADTMSNVAFQRAIEETFRQDDRERGVSMMCGGTERGSRQTNNALGTVIDTCHDHVDRVAAEVGVTQETRISMDRPPQAKTKGRCKTSSEKNEVTLGAQGEKKGNRRCSVCHLYSTHNSVTCPTLEKNKDRLDAKKNKKRGRHAGANNKKNKSDHGNDRNMQEERPMERRRLLEDRSYIEIHRNSDDDDEYVDDENVDEADLV